MSVVINVQGERAQVKRVTSRRQRFTAVTCRAKCFVESRLSYKCKLVLNSVRVGDVFTDTYVV